MAETRDPRSALIDAMAPEEKILALEYFQGSDPERFDEAAREARIRYERAGGYRADRPTPETRDDLRQRYAEALLPLLPGDLYGSPAGGVAGRLVDAVLAARDDELERCRREVSYVAETGERWRRLWELVDRERSDALVRAEEAEAKLAGADPEQLAREAEWLLAENRRLREEAAKGLSHERERIMRDWAKKPPCGKVGVTEWVQPTNRLLADDDAPFLGVLHVRDPGVPPKLARPTTVRGRYLDGQIREAGPGSHVGITLCGVPMMADEVWCSARGSLQHAYNHSKNGVCCCVALCGMCSFLAGRPTIEAAWEDSGHAQH